MGFWNTIASPFKAIEHGVESIVDDIEDGASAVFHGIGEVAEHVEHDVGSILEHAEHDVGTVVSWGGERFTQAEDAGIGAINSMEMLPYLAAGVVAFMILNASTTSQVIDSGARAASQFR